MNLEINGKTIEVKFTIGAIRELDKRYQIENGAAKFGMGISSAMIYLRQYNPVILVDIMEALQSGQLKIGKSEIEAWLMTQDVKKLSDDLLKEMGKQPLTKPMIDQFSKEAKKAEAQATNKKGKPVFESFKSFYDYEKRVAEVLAANQPQRTKLNEWKKTQLATVAERLRRYREGRRVDGE